MRPFLLVLALGIALFALACAALDLPAFHYHIDSESGTVQRASTSLWAVLSLGSLLTALQRTRRLEWLAAAVLFAILAGRELDMQQILAWNITKPVNFFRSHIPLWERLAVGIGLWGALALSLAILIRRGIIYMKQHPATGRDRFFGALPWATLLAAALFMDKAHLLLKALHGPLTLVPYLEGIEEIAEMLLPLYIALRLIPLAWTHWHTHAPAHHETPNTPTPHTA